MNLKELRSKLDELTAKARAQLDKIKDDTAEDAVRAIEADHDSVMAQIEDVKRQIAEVEAAEKAEKEGREAPSPAQDLEAMAARAVKEERLRITTIQAVGAQAKVERSLIDEHLAAGTTVHAFRKIILEKLFTEEQKQPQTNSVVHVGQTDDEKRAPVIENALLHRCDPRIELVPGASEYRGMSLLDVGKEMAERRGEKVRGLNRHQLAEVVLKRSGGMMSTSDFPSILANVINKTLRAAYQAAPQTWRPLVRETTVADFKQVSRVQLGEAPQLELVNEHGEFKRGSMGEAKEVYQIATYGKVVPITRQVIINDDLSAFTRLPRSFGQSAANLESDLVWSQILNTSATMGDGVVLFHATHANLGSTAAIGVTSVGEGRKLMALQTGLDGVTPLAIYPNYLIVPENKRVIAEQFVSTLIYPAQSTDVVPASLQRLQIISEPRLDVGVTVNGSTYSGSSTAWYMAATPDQIDIIEIAYLEGARGVYTETRVGFDVDGIEIKARLDVGAKVIDWRGLVKNAGS